MEDASPGRNGGRTSHHSPPGKRSMTTRGRTGDEWCWVSARALLGSACSCRDRRRNYTRGEFGGGRKKRHLRCVGGSRRWPDRPAPGDGGRNGGERRRTSACVVFWWSCECDSTGAAAVWRLLEGNGKKRPAEPGQESRHAADAWLLV
jgi:hypothetical protein